MRLAAIARNGYDFRILVNDAPEIILCDGCGLPASPEHIRERLAHLEVATRFRPIHIDVLFVIPSPNADHDFYDASPQPPGKREVLLDALRIPIAVGAGAAPDANATESRLAEFQRRGFFFAAVSECPMPPGAAAQTVERLAPTLVKRVQFSYRPKSVVLLSDALAPLVPLLAGAGRGIRVMPDGAALSWPRIGDRDAEFAFRAECARIAVAART
ncbi:MAG: hypothetical protein WBF35_13655 [Candidatus Acidiferrales bacterium]